MPILNLDKHLFEKVSQRLMVQGYSGHATYTGGLDVVRKVVKSDGIRGLYRGFGLSVLTYSPSSAVWWATYGASQRVIWRYCIKHVLYMLYFQLMSCTILSKLFYLAPPC